MAEKSIQQRTDGSGSAAFALAQMVFWWLVQQGLLPKAQAEQMLRQAIKPTRLVAKTINLRPRNWLPCSRACKSISPQPATSRCGRTSEPSLSND